MLCDLEVGDHLFVVKNFVIEKEKITQINTSWKALIFITEKNKEHFVIENITEKQQQAVTAYATRVFSSEARLKKFVKAKKNKKLAESFKLYKIITRRW